MEQCPICHNHLQVRDCTPCNDCGGRLLELKGFTGKDHVYRTYEIYEELQLTLCNFCDIDFGSSKSEFFGFNNGRRIGFQDFQFIREIENPKVTKQRFCAQCSYTLQFLNFLYDIRVLNSKSLGNT